MMFREALNDGNPAAAQERLDQLLGAAVKPIPPATL
jgi:hypothetical protein